MVANGVDLVILDFSANFPYLTGIPYPRASPTGDVFSDTKLGKKIRCGAQRSAPDLLPRTGAFVDHARLQLSR